MSTVFEVPGFLGLPQTLDFQLSGDVTHNNTTIPVNYPNFTPDSLLIALGPQIIPDDWLVSIIAGRDALDAAMVGVTGPKVVFAHSLGAVVACRWLHDIGPSSTIPPSDLTFVLIGNPVRRYGGIFYHDDYGAPADTPYQVTDIRKMFDGWCDWPNRNTSPSYLLAIANAVTGANVYHPNYTDAHLTDPTYPTYTEGNITYVLVPTRPWWQNDYTLELIQDAYSRPEIGGTAGVLPAAVSTWSPVKKRYPKGPITPVGAAMLDAGSKPKMTYRAYDDSTVFELLGPLAQPDPMQPEAIHILDIKGLIPPWTNITQKGASQDGSTYVTSLYDEMEADLTVMARGRVGEPTRTLIRTWIDSWDAKKPGELSFWVPEAGRWFAPIRWGKQPVDNLIGGNWTRQKFGWVAKVYDAFWRTYDDIDTFAVDYSGVVEEFDADTTSGGGLTGWTLVYNGTGGGYIYESNHMDIFGIPIGFPAGGQAMWFDDPAHPVIDPGRTVVARKDGFTSATDNQVVTMQFGSFPEVSFPDEGYNDLWARMSSVAPPGDTGIRLRISLFSARLSYFSGGAEVVLRETLLIIPPMPGETFTLVCGSQSNLRSYTVQRNLALGTAGVDIMTVVESGSNSQIGPNYRMAGMGMHAGASLFFQAVPASVLRWTAGDNTDLTREGFLTRFNPGDQDRWDRFTCFGPGTFTFSNGPVDGPGGQDSITFGPLLDGQRAQLRTDPRRRGVVDLTSTPVTVQQQNAFAQAIVDVINWATGNNVPPLLQALESAFGIAAPQGPLYSLLKGRWSNPIPAKSPGNPTKTYEVKVSIAGGGPSSRVIAAGTPLRRYPL